jgi:cysteine desulfurase/selenocysteine lyase
MKFSPSSLGCNCRKDFPILSTGLVYFDSAATSQKPQCVIDTLSQFYAQEYATVHRAIYRLAAEATERYHKVRARAATFLGAAFPEEIIFTRGTTESLNLIAASYGRTHLKRGDEIIISQMEHHSNIVPWQMLCKEIGAHLKVIPVDETGVLDLRVYEEELLSPRTKIVSIAHISNVTGTLNPLPRIIASAHAAGAIVAIDGAQSAGHVPVDVQALDADFFAFSGHKAFGPTGIGILYGKAALLEKMPPIYGGGDMIEKVTFEQTSFQKPPLRFEAGTPMIAEVIGLGAALDYIEMLGRQTIAAYEHELLLYATKALQTLKGIKIIGTAPEKGAIISFTIEGVHPLDLATLLDLQGFALRSGHLCAQPLLQRFGLSALCRVSFAPFNTFEEIDRFVQALESVAQQLRR